MCICNAETDLDNVGENDDVAAYVIMVHVPN
jgi:hypothetical protein